MFPGAEDSRGVPVGWLYSIRQNSAHGELGYVRLYVLPHAEASHRPWSKSCARPGSKNRPVRRGCRPTRPRPGRHHEAMDITEDEMNDLLSNDDRDAAGEGDEDEYEWFR
ncbi:hypothetical protein ACVWZD_000341 [Streptomyces sp. TE3672]